MKKTLSFIIKLIGLATAICSSFYIVLKHFIINQPARTTWSISGFILLGITFLIVKRYASVWLKTKLNAVETARELKVNGNTSPLLATVLKAVYAVLPALLFVLLFYGISKYNGLLWLNTLKLVGTISIYFVFEFVAVVLERYFNKKRELKKLETEKEDLAERVAKKIKFN